MRNRHKFAYFGTPYFSTFVLDELEKAGYLPAQMVTSPDKPAGRGLALTKSAVKEWAERHDIPVLQPEKFTDELIQKVKAENFDLFVVAAYGKILPSSILEIPKLGNLNVHPSLLPKYRGTSPVESQILGEEKAIGVSIIKMDAEMDHGPIVLQEQIANSHLMSRTELNKILWTLGGRLLTEALSKWPQLPLHEQDHSQATFTKKIKKEEGEIDLQGDPKTNYLKYLAYEGWPGSYFFENGRRMKITRARFEGAHFIVERVIPEGKPEQAYSRPR